MPPTAGITTSEFWTIQITSLLAAVVAVAGDFGLFHWNGAQQTDVTTLVVIVIAILQAVYALVRAQVKVAASNNPVKPPSVSPLTSTVGNAGPVSVPVGGQNAAPFNVPPVRPAP